MPQPGDVSEVLSGTVAIPAAVSSMGSDLSEDFNYTVWSANDNVVCCAAGGARDSPIRFSDLPIPGDNADAPLPPLRLHRLIPGAFVYDGAPIEATGLSLNAFGRGVAGMSTLFLGPALITLAKSTAKANGTHRVYGMKPSSIMTNIGAFSGLVSSVLLPLFGAMVDHTPHRNVIGAGSAMSFTALKGIEIFVSESTWFWVAILQVVNSVFHNAHLCTVYAYTAELSAVPAEQTSYNAQFQALQYVSMLLFLTLVMILSTVIRTNNVGTARISQTLSFLLCASVWGLSWKFYFRKRSALSHIPSGSNLFKAGLQKLSVTSSLIWTNWRAPRFFLISVMLSESATAALSTISTTYMSQLLDMNAHQIGKAFFFVFLAGIPGSKIGGLIGVALNPLRSAQICLIILIVNTSLASWILRGPSSQNIVYLFCSVWGAGLGWLHPMHSALYCTIIPRGQESELMGIYIFSGSILGWLPSFLFSLLNELGVSMNLGLASLNLFFVGGLLALHLIGNYNFAVDFATHPRLDSGLNRASVDDNERSKDDLKGQDSRTSPKLV